MATTLSKVLCIYIHYIICGPDGAFSAGTVQGLKIRGCDSGVVDSDSHFEGSGV